MSRYSIHFVTREGQAAVQPEALHCDDDTQAENQARMLVGTDFDVEVWEGRRLVALFPHK